MFPRPSRPPPVALLLLLLATLAGGCGQSPQLAPLPADATILAFGDSLTYGTGASAEQAYPAQLARLSGREVINAGVPGELSHEGRLRLPEELERYHPDLLLLCHGGNDLLRQKDAEALRANLEAMVNEARGRGIPVVLIGVPKPKLLLLESAAVYEQVAEAMAIPAQLEILPEVEADRALKSDPIHPNAAGYRRMAEALHAFLQERGAL